MRFSTFYLPLYFVLLFLFSCEKDKAPEPVVVTAISPTTGPHSTLVTITGSGFNTTAASNLVKFNGKEAIVQSATATELVVVVPKSAGTGAVSVQEVAGPEFKFEFTTVVSTLAGSGTTGFVNGTGTSASFNSPNGIAVDTLGNIYVADFSNNAIRKITSAGVATTLAGNQSYGFTNGNGTASRFSGPNGLALDKSGNVYVADRGNHSIRKITAIGLVTTIAGSGNYGNINGNGSNAKFFQPTGVAIDANGYLFVTDRDNHLIRKISPAGDVGTFAGAGIWGYRNGIATSALFSSPGGLTIDTQGNILIADENNHCIRKITADGVVSTVAGSTDYGFKNGNAKSAEFYFPSAIIVDEINNIYVADTWNNRIRKITPEGIVSTLAGDGKLGYKDGSDQTAQFNKPRGISIDKNGVIYIADTGNHRIRKIIQE